jgi:hypothetical protein
MAASLPPTRDAPNTPPPRPPKDKPLHEHALKLGEEFRINRNVLDLPHAAAHAKLVLLEQVAELIPVDQIDGRRPVAGGLALGFGGEGARRDQQALSPRSLIAPRKSRTAPEPTLPT